MNPRLEKLAHSLEGTLGARLVRLAEHVGELTVETKGADAVAVCQLLRDSEGLKFEQLIDLCGVDYSDYKEGAWQGRRYAVAYHLLSVTLNQRVRVRAFVGNDDFPVVASMVDVWPAANWYEREAFDLFGIMFEGHPDLRRILTDYGFIGHPFRKDFPISGYVEMRFDPEQKRVVYQPVTIEPREVTPRIVREEHYGERR